MQDHCPKEGLFSIGLTSGLGSVAYSVLEGTKVRGWEVMPGPRKKRQVSAYRRYKAHRLMFEAIFMRWPPAVIGLGPPSSEEESVEWVMFMRTAVLELGKSVGIPVVLFDTDKHLIAALHNNNVRPGSGLKALVRCQVPRFRSNKKRVILATATALAAAAHIEARDFMEKPSR